MHLAARSILRVDDEAVGERDLPFLAAEPALGLVEETLDLAMLAGDTRDGETRALPHVVVVDLGDGGADAVLELGLRGAHEMPLLLQRVRLREVQLARQHADETAGHLLIQAQTTRSMISAPSRTIPATSLLKYRPCPTRSSR